MKTIPSHIPIKPPVSRQFKNRLYDRDTLLLSHYDVNFSLCSRFTPATMPGQKPAWRHSVRDKFRRAVQDMLKEKFEFYALAAHPDVDASTYSKRTFQETLGKDFPDLTRTNSFSARARQGVPGRQRPLAGPLLGETSMSFPWISVKDPSVRLENRTKTSKAP